MCVAPVRRRQTPTFQFATNDRAGYDRAVPKPAVPALLIHADAEQTSFPFPPQAKTISNTAPARWPGMVCAFGGKT
jgi:hypothetical protein